MNFLTPEEYFKNATKSDFFKKVNESLKEQYDKNPIDIDTYAQRQAEDWARLKDVEIGKKFEQPRNVPFDLNNN